MRNQEHFAQQKEKVYMETCVSLHSVRGVGEGGEKQNHLWKSKNDWSDNN